MSSAATEIPHHRDIDDATTFLFTSESVGEGHPGLRLLMYLIVLHVVSMNIILFLE